MAKQIIPEKEQQNVLDILWLLLQEAEGKCSNDPTMKMWVSQTYDLLNRIGFTKHRPRWETIPPQHPPIEVAIHPQGGITCAEKCIFSSECSNHASAGEFREDGFTPELSLVKGKIFCKTKFRRPLNNAPRYVPENYDHLGRGVLTKTTSNTLEPSNYIKRYEFGRRENHRDP